LTSESVAEKIKLIAERKPHFGILPSNKKIDKLEDTTTHFVWRWELTSVELLLNPESVAHVRKVRACRKRLASHYKAIVKLLELIRNKKDIGNAEERVLKFEREEEARRLMKKKEFLKKEESQKQKAALLLRKEEEAAKKETEKLLKEQERARLKSLKEEEKRQKEEEKQKARMEKEKVELEHLALAEKAIKKQKAFMAKFFVHEKFGRSNDVLGMESVEKCSKQEMNHHKVETFWNQLGSSSIPVHVWRGKKKGHCFRGTEHIRVSVTVTVAPLLPSGFNTEDQCYSERRIISVPNKLKFLKFFEDYRPPYHGTWSKPKSKLVSGRHPFGKDESHLNYEVDSEAEWEEEAEDGEDLDSVAKDDEEEDADEDPGVDTLNYNYADGWLARDAKCEQQNEEEGMFSSWFLVAPVFDGTPMLNYSFAKEEERNDYVVGLPVKETLELLSMHKSIITQVGEEGLNICLDPYKPVPEVLVKTKSDENTCKKEIHVDDLRSFCHFVHGCTLSSKEKIVEEFRKSYPNILCSRAELFRKLDSISVKHRIPRGGTLWEVTQGTADDLELDLLKVRDSMIL
jgi:chromatin assembly factor 1 subunit A